VVLRLLWWNLSSEQGLLSPKGEHHARTLNIIPVFIHITPDIFDVVLRARGAQLRKRSEWRGNKEDGGIRNFHPQCGKCQEWIRERRKGRPTLGYYIRNIKTVLTGPSASSICLEKTNCHKITIVVVGADRNWIFNLRLWSARRNLPWSGCDFVAESRCGDLVQSHGCIPKKSLGHLFPAAASPVKMDAVIHSLWLTDKPSSRQTTISSFHAYALIEKTALSFSKRNSLCPGPVAILSLRLREV
jgi:hypothetical protein